MEDVTASRSRPSSPQMAMGEAVDWHARATSLEAELKRRDEARDLYDPELHDLAEAISDLSGVRGAVWVIALPAGHWRCVLAYIQQNGAADA